MTRPRSVSVVIPTYNRASFLTRTLDSVFSQTVPVEEVWLVDDGSTDDTARLVESLVRERRDWAERLRYQYQENQGKSVALNRALRQARGEWIAFDDSDDYWLPEKLEWQFRALEEFPDCRACFTNAVFASDAQLQGTTLEMGSNTYPHRIGREDDPARLFIHAWPGIVMQSMTVRADALHEFGEFNPALHVGQDIDFLFRLGLVTPFCYVNLPLVVLQRAEGRTHGLMTEFPLMSPVRLQARVRRLQDWRELTRRARPDLHGGVCRELRNIRNTLANVHLSRGELPAARAVLRRSLRDDPDWRMGLKWALSLMGPVAVRALMRRRRESPAPVEAGRQSATSKR